MRDIRAANPGITQEEAVKRMPHEMVEMVRNALMRSIGHEIWIMAEHDPRPNPKNFPIKLPLKLRQRLPIAILMDGEFGGRQIHILYARREHVEGTIAAFRTRSFPDDADRAAALEEYKTICRPPPAGSRARMTTERTN